VSAANAPTFCDFPSAGAMIETLAGDIAARLNAAVRSRGKATLVVPGGTTPGDLYDVLSRQRASWASVSVTLSDERWVETSSDKSNERLVRTRLLVDEAAAARLVPLKTHHASAQDAEPEVHAAIAPLLPFDIVLLGMGTDGHTASLIPGAKGLDRAMDGSDPMLVRAMDPPQPMGERMTLTLRAVLSSRRIVVLIRGEAKLAAYRDALGTSDVLAAPIHAVLGQSDVPVDVFWSP
jgi:6-phosphogluconolactonase